MRRIALVACSKTKNPKAVEQPDELFSAQDMYIGNNYRKALSEGLGLFGCEDYFILSGKHGLLKKTDKIKYYDCYLAKKRVGYRRQWSDGVYQALEASFNDLSDIQFVFFAGSKYYEYLKDRLNCIMLVFNGQHMTFDVKEEHYVQG